VLERKQAPGKRQGLTGKPTTGAIASQPAIQPKFPKGQGKKVYYTVEELMSLAGIEKLSDKFLRSYILDLAALDEVFEDAYNLDTIVKFAKKKFEESFPFGKTGGDHGGFGEYVETTKEHNKNWEAFVDDQIGKARMRMGLLRIRPDFEKVHGEKFDHVASMAKHKSLIAISRLDEKSGKFKEDLQGKQMAQGWSEIEQPQIIQQNVREVWEEVIHWEKQYMKRDTGPETPVPLVPVWGGTTAAGVGTFVHAAFQPNTTYPAGSSPDGVATSYESIHAGRGINWSGNQKFFIKGHLLNDHIGGPGRPYNLAPIGGHDTEEPGTHVNWIQQHQAESPAKKNVEEMQKNRYREPYTGQIIRVEYSVVTHAPLPRPETAMVKQIANDWPEKIRSYKADNSDKEPTVFNLLTYIAAKDGGNFKYFKECVDAVLFDSVHDHNGKLAKDIAAKLMNNAALWGKEDITVPAGLTWRLSVWTRIDKTDNNPDKKEYGSSIPNVKPGKLSKRYLGD